MTSVFAKIVSGEISSYKIAETPDFLAFLDVFPLVKGHTLVIPKKQTDYIFDLSDEDFTGLHLFSKKVAQAMMNVIPCKRIGTAVIGLEVSHAHIHLVPINSMKDLNFQNPKLSFSEPEMKQIAVSIQNAYQHALKGQP